MGGDLQEFKGAGMGERHMFEATADRGWYVAQVRPNALQAAKRNLLRQGFEVFVPLLEQSCRQGRKFVTSLRPLFPGYLFVQDEAAGGNLQAINSTYGVSKLVSFGYQPSKVPTKLIDAIKQRCDPDGLFQSAAELQVGDAVTVAAGPFSSFLATVEKVDQAKRIWILLEVMGRTQRLSVPSHSLLKA
jgi:transcriptional antiterminator RfaH